MVEYFLLWFSSLPLPLPKIDAFVSDCHIVKSKHNSVHVGTTMATFYGLSVVLLAWSQSR